MEGLYREHGPALLGYLERWFGHYASPEDLLQETFVEALDSAERCLAAKSPRAFLFGIARNVGLAAQRRARVRRARSLIGVDPPTASGSERAVEEMRDAIGRLPEQLRETLELRLREELSYEEIAAVLEIPIGTVRSRLHNAVKLLREAL